jgi:hypothetical protein
LARSCKKAVDAARRVIQYILTTRDFAIEWKLSRQSQQDQTDNVLIGTVDASFAMDTYTRRSHGGYINFVNDGAVSWKSGLQSIVTLSSCEAEYITLCSEVCEVRYLRSLLRSLGLNQRDSTVIWTDQGALVGFGAFVFIAQVTQQRQIAQIEGVSEQFLDRVRILETLLQKTDENVRDHQLRIIELESTLVKEKRKVNIKEEAGAPEASKSPYFILMR